MIKVPCICVRGQREKNFNHSLGGGFNPSEKISIKLDHFNANRGENKKDT